MAEVWMRLRGRERSAMVQRELGGLGMERRGDLESKVGERTKAHLAMRTRLVIH